MVHTALIRFTELGGLFVQKTTVHLIIVGLLLFNLSLNAQNTIDSTGVATEVVDVVKSYTPTIVLRPKSKWPSLDQSDHLPPRPEFDYEHEVLEIKATDLAAILAPTRVSKQTPTGHLPNYFRIWLGTKASAGIEGFLSHEMSKEADLSLAVNHEQLNGPIEGVSLPADWSESGLRTQWRSKLADRSSILGLSLSRSAVQWYGIPATIVTDSLIAEDFGQIYQRGTLYHRLGSNGGWFTGLDNELTVFSDRYGVREWNLSSAPRAEFIWDKRLIALSGSFSFLSMSLGLDDPLITAADYTALNVDMGVQTDFNFGMLKVNLGAKVWGHKGTQKSTLRLFPEVDLSYPILGRSLKAYLGFSGQYKQYQASTLTQAQAFLAPGLELRPQIDRQIFRLGLSGVLTDHWQYNLSVSYRNFEDQAYFVQRPWSGAPGEFAYDNGNSFTLDYDSGTELKYSVDINGRLSERWDFSLETSIVDNRPSNIAEPWNVPKLSVGGSGTYHFSEQLLLTGRFISYGPRMDQSLVADQLIAQKVDGFFDAQLHLYYAMTKNFSASISGINLLNQNKGLWVNYPVQGLRLNLGLQYNFKAF